MENNQQSKEQSLQKTAIGNDENYTASGNHVTVTAKDFRNGVMPRAQLSMAASKIAVDKASNSNTREFAGWELMEAIAVIDYLKDLGTPAPPLSGESEGILSTLKGLKGAAFDRAYMEAEQGNHEWLRDLAQNYLNGPDAKAVSGDTYRLATVALFSFTEHVGLSKKINVELNA